MDKEFALQLADIRLLQTLRLLERALNDHPDQEAVADIVVAIATSRDHLRKLGSRTANSWGSAPAA
jgi:hypothetical protein